MDRYGLLRKVLNQKRELAIYLKENQEDMKVRELSAKKKEQLPN